MYRSLIMDRPGGWSSVTYPSPSSQRTNQISRYLKREFLVTLASLLLPSSRSPLRSRSLAPTMSTGVLLSLPSPSLASPIARSRLQCRPPALARGGPITAPADPLRLLGPALPITGMLSMIKKANKRLGGVTCYAAPLSPHTVQWVSAVSIAVLMFAKGTAIHKSFLLPLFALQAPSSVISWIKGDYGTWMAFLAFLVRLFYYIPGQLELPFFTLLLVIVAPHQAMNLRDTQSGSIVSLAIAAYLAFQHFSKVGSVRSALDKSSIVATSAIIFITIIPCLFLL